MSDASGQSFLVVGASGALGSRIARGLADAGAGVSVHGRTDESLDRLTLEGAHRLTGDLRRPALPQQLVDAAVQHHGHLDGVVYAAGVVAFGPAAQLDDDTLDDLTLLDFLAPVRLVRAALHVLGEGGVVAALTGVPAERPFPHMAAYGATKAALSSYLTAVRTESRRARVRVLDLRPPHTETGLATRAIAGDPPTMPTGLDPDVVAARAVRAILGTDTEVASGDFG